jgi:hypothetical protein
VALRVPVLFNTSPQKNRMKNKIITFEVKDVQFFG